MNDEHKEKIYYIQQQADELSAEISKLMRKDADLSEKHLNELIKLGVFISMTCQELLDEEQFQERRTQQTVFYVKEVINAYFTMLSYIRYSLLLKIKYELLKSAYRAFNINIPWKGDFDAFMGNKDNHLVFS